MVMAPAYSFTVTFSHAFSFLSCEMFSLAYLAVIPRHFCIQGTGGFSVLFLCDGFFSNIYIYTLHKEL